MINIAIIFMFTLLSFAGVIFYYLGASEIFLLHFNNLSEFILPFLTFLIALRNTSLDKGHNPLLKIWLWIGLGALAWGIGGALTFTYSIIHPGESVPYPWYSDIGYILLVPFMFIGLISLPRALQIPIPTLGMISALIAFLLSIGFYIWLIWIDSGFYTEANVIEILTEVAYTLADPLLLGATIAVASILGTSVAGKPLWFLLIGLILYFISDTIYAYIEWKEFFEEGDTMVMLADQVLYIGWFLGFTFISLAAIKVYDTFAE